MDLGAVFRLVERGVAIVGPFAGLLVGHRLATSQARDQRKRDRVSHQIDELYSPLLGLLERALSLAALRTEIGAGADRVWRLLVQQGALTPETEALTSASFDRIIQYNNSELRDEILPLYQEMLRIFTQRHGLAEPSTRAHFPALIGFSGLWRRQLTDPLPSAVLRELPNPGPDLDKFHTDLVMTLDRLRASL